MAARCASCSYPLSISDSVSCCECLSYFHIDCAQLVGFPYYELSSDPIRNTFHCQTCKILPLPHQSDSFSDSDSDGDCIMPSRQLDYHLEGQPDFAKDMNEIKGTVQDLSELCKDMFREINELKSINLTLRCCVENLKHDGEQRDSLLAELKRRVDALEGKGVVNLIKPIDTTNMYVERISIEDTERYLTPDPEYSRLKEIETLEQGSFHNEGNQVTDEIQHFDSPNVESYLFTEGKSNIIEKSVSQGWESPKSEIDKKEIPRTNDTEHTENEINFDEENEINPKDEKVHFAETNITSTTVNKANTEKYSTGSVKDWDWNGHNAIQLKNTEDKTENSAEEEENEPSDNENTETQGWEMLDEDSKSELITKDYEEKTSKSTENVEESEEEEEDDDEDEEETEEEAEEIREAWADEVEKYDKDEDSLISGEEAEEIIEKTDDKCLAEIYQPVIVSRDILQVEETEEHNEEIVEEADRTSLHAEERVETPKPEMIDVEIVEGSGGPEVEDYIKAVYTGMVKSEEGLRLEGGVAVQEGAEPDGEATEGGQSPEAQGEVQPSEPLEESEPPPPPQPQHSPDDLWDYLKETVTGEHPTTVEEFVQKLIGTLEHVPEEYLTPVIDYNIKRATSPSVTDGEHQDGDHHLEGEGHGLEQTGPGENGEVASEGDHTNSVPEGGASVTQRDGFPSEDSVAHTTDIPEEPSQSAEGYSAVEAPA